VHELQSLGWCALFIPPAEAKVVGPERKKLGKKLPRLCILGVRALGWFELM